MTRRGDRYFLEWSPNRGETYGVYLAQDAGGYQPCVATAIEADPKNKETTFGPFTNPRNGGSMLKFEPKMSYWALSHLYQQLGEFRFSRLVETFEGKFIAEFFYRNGSQRARVC